MERKYLLVLILALITLTSCVKEQAPVQPIEPTPENQVINIPNEVFVAGTNAFVDPDGNYRIVGSVVNNTDQVVNSIQIIIEIRDGDGDSLLMDETGTVAESTVIYPFLFTISPGKVSPFSITYNPSNGTPASYGASVLGYQNGESDQASLVWEKVQIIDDGIGWFYLTGILINQGDQWAHINSLAGAVLDDNDRVLSTEWTSTYATELAPAGDLKGRDRTPFISIFPNPNNSTKWNIYWDAVITEKTSDQPLDVTVSNIYLDQYASLHLVGLIKNSSDQVLDSMVIGGVYSTDGTVLDASYAFVPVPIRPGEEMPFGISAFTSILRNNSLASLVETSTAQVDSWYTTPSETVTVDLVSSDDSVLIDGSVWAYSGNVINTSDKELSYITVIVKVNDSQGNLVAMDYTTISNPEGTIKPGDTYQFSVTLYLDPTVDATGFTATSLAIGDQN